MFDMLHAFYLGFTQVFDPTTFGLMTLGIAIGFVVGILPGLGGPTTLALMLPFVIKMSAVEAFAFLLGMAAVTATTGDITSIIIGIPGEPTTVATIVDGHPMAKKGEAGRALGAALLSSLIGAVFGAFTLAAAIPIIRPLVLSFGSPEFFMVAVLGLTFVASLSGDAFLKGLISGGLGLFLATVGVSHMSGLQRFTFGQTFLWDGVGLVPIAIGLFAIPEIIDLAVQGTGIAREKAGKLGGVMEGVKDTFRHWWLVIRCSALGAFVAIIPGIGAGTVQWLSYAHAVQSSPDKERFGKGAIEGVLGPGAANNSTLGGSLLTTVSFGIPASVSMAILMGAFVIQGIVPGPDMLLPEPEGHLALTFSFVWINVVSNILTVGICFLFLSQLVKVTTIRGSLLIPFILMLIYLGAFAEKNVFQDLIVVVVFGVLGWVMLQTGWPRPPMVLGLVLGPLAENRLFVSVDAYGLAWLWRPGVLILMALTVFGAFYPMLRLRSRRREIAGPSPSDKPFEERRAISERFNRGTAFGLFLIAVFAVALWKSLGFDFRTGLFPWVIGVAVFGLTITQVAMDIAGGGREKSVDNEEPASDLPPLVVKRRTMGMFFWIFVYFTAIWLLGFSIGVPLCAFFHLKAGFREKWILSVIMTLFLGVFIYGIFYHLLHIPFPDGQLLLWLHLV